MVAQQIDGHLRDWEEIKDLGWSEILLGNGFSMNIWDGFGYSTLYSISCDEDLEHHLNTEAKKIFDELETINFEDSLQVLKNALLVDEIIGGGQTVKLKELYNNIRIALANAVNCSHIPPNTCDLGYLNAELLNYKTIFTTNYDLIPYWAIMEKDNWKFRDYFWSENNSFDSSNTSISADRTRILYIHGALHLVEDASKKAYKLVADGLHRLLDLFALYNDDIFPLFITEGDSKGKLEKIYSSPYLRFAYEELIKGDSSLVILGHSLNEKCDGHLISALQNSSRDRI